jgi:hypothetical protein
MKASQKYFIGLIKTNYLYLLSFDWERIYNFSIINNIIPKKFILEIISSTVSKGYYYQELVQNGNEKLYLSYLNKDNAISYSIIKDTPLSFSKNINIELFNNFFQNNQNKNLNLLLSQNTGESFLHFYIEYESNYTEKENQYILNNYQNNIYMINFNCGIHKNDDIFKKYFYFEISLCGELSINLNHFNIKQGNITYKLSQNNNSFIYFTKKNNLIYGLLNLNSSEEVLMNSREPNQFYFKYLFSDKPDIIKYNAEKEYNIVISKLNKNSKENLMIEFNNYDTDRLTNYFLLIVNSSEPNLKNECNIKNYILNNIQDLENNYYYSSFSYKGKEERIKSMFILNEEGQYTLYLIVEDSSIYHTFLILDSINYYYQKENSNDKNNKSNQINNEKGLSTFSIILIIVIVVLLIIFLIIILLERFKRKKLQNDLEFSIFNNSNHSISNNSDNSLEDNKKLNISLKEINNNLLIDKPQNKELEEGEAPLPFVSFLTYNPPENQIKIDMENRNKVVKEEKNDYKKNYVNINTSPGE